mmetsp:Transcript_7451/g.13327  ORF Transcript_7451/g.13327 Transcript_7451/m.13327 type:complete len:571 (+) Transcript_7451:83-1795(+)
MVLGSQGLLNDVARAVDLQQHAVEALAQSASALSTRQAIVARQLRSDAALIESLKSGHKLTEHVATREFEEGRIIMVVIFFVLVLMWIVFQAWPPLVKRLRKAGIEIGEWHISPSLAPKDGPLVDEDGEQESLNYEPACVWVLATTDREDVVWRGAWRVTQEDAKKLLNAIESSTGRVDGKLNLKELQDFAEKHKHDRKVGDLGSLPTSAQGIYVPSVVKTAFRQYDHDGNGYLDADEWHDFLRHLEVLHLQYLHQKALNDFRAFWGRDGGWEPDLDLFGAGMDAHTRAALEDELAHAAGEAMLSDPPTAHFQFGRDPDTPHWFELPPGWWRDLSYNIANSHSLLGIVACDPVHPLTGMERLVIEISTLGFMLYTERLRKFQVQKAMGLMMIFGMALAGIVINLILTHLFTTPGYGHVDEARATAQQRRRAKVIQVVMAAIGYFLVLLSGILCYLFLRNSEHLTEYLALSLMGRFQGYMLEFMYKLFWTFNPYIAWGEPDPSKVRSSFIGQAYDFTWSVVGLGQWRIEKQRFQRSCMLGLEDLHAQAGEGSGALTALRKLTTSSKPLGCC